ncbi:MAG TPA: hypothetical protein V6D11_10730 [Waterburya sp.]
MKAKLTCPVCDRPEISGDISPLGANSYFPGSTTKVDTCSINVVQQR